jgi:hypothetical protein
MKKYLLLIIIIATTLSMTAQENTKFYGYIQPLIWHFESNQDFGKNVTYNTAGIAQSNFFLTSDFKNDLSVLINFELINNFSSEKEWGALNLQEAYLKWSPSENLNLKFGQVIPAFNNLFEKYNNTPELPYLLSPKLYEVTLGNLVDIFDNLPQKAIIQASGELPLNNYLILDYAASLNHSINKFHSSPQNDLRPYYVSYGQSAESYIGYGGRIGLRSADVKLGVSVYSDVSNQRKFKWTENGDMVDLGDMGRIKFGFDFSVRKNNFTLSGEFLLNKTSISDRRVDVKNVYENNRDTSFTTVDNFLNYAHSKNRMFIGNGFDRTFYYISLMYNFTQDVFVYAMYDYMQDLVDPYYFGTDGYKGVSLGGGWKVNPNVVLKSQGVYNFIKYENTKDYINYVITDYTEFYLVVGASISF